MQLDREGSPPPGSRLPQAQLSRNSNQIARGRIRRFESYMPSQPVRSLCLPRLASDGVSVLGLHPSLQSIETLGAFIDSALIEA